MGTRSFLGVKRPGRGADDPPPSSAEVKERVELYLYSISGPLWPVIGWTLPLPLPLVKGRCSEQVLYPPQVAVESLAGIPQTFILDSMLCACLSLNNIFLLFWDCGKHKLHFHFAETSNFLSVYCLKKKLLTLSVTHITFRVSMSPLMCDLFCYRWNRSLRKCRMK
jgi:hypothetical protein